MTLSLLAQSEPGTALVRLTISNGDQISGRVIEVTAEGMVIESSYAGRLSIRAAEIRTWQTSDDKLRAQLAALLPQDRGMIIDVRAAAQQTEAEARKGKKGIETTVATPAPAPKPNLWEQGVNLAWTMSRGNANVSDISAAYSAARKEGSRRLAFSSFGRYGVSNGRETASLLTSSLRYERTVGKLPAFVESLFEIDRIKNLDYRFTENIGLTWPVVRGDGSQLSLDFGTGFTREDFDQGAERTSASGLLRFKASQKLSERTLLSQQATLFSLLDNLSSYRVQAEASMTTPITRHIALRVSGINRFDARPQGLARPNDFTLLTGFTFKF